LIYFAKQIHSYNFTHVILQNKNAIIYGAGGSLGGAVAKALAAAGRQIIFNGS
jgi:NADP-dependent 3-hydroxy acid dehydrogenase YdfG